MVAPQSHSLRPIILRPQVPALFEPGHTAVTAAMAAAAASSQASCPQGGGAGNAGAPTPSADGNLSSKSSGGKATTPSTPAEGGWSGENGARAERGSGARSGGSGGGTGDKRADCRVTSSGQSSGQVRRLVGGHSLSSRGVGQSEASFVSRLGSCLDRARGCFAWGAGLTLGLCSTAPSGRDRSSFSMLRRDLS